MGTFVVHRVANVSETVLWTDEAPRPREKGNAGNPGRRAQKRDNNFHSITKTILPGYWVVLARASSPIPQAVGTGKRGLRALTLVYPTPPPPPSSAAHLAYLVFWKSSSLARVNITAVPSAPDPGLERGNAGSRCRRRSRLEGRRILGQLHGP